MNELDEKPASKASSDLASDLSPESQKLGERLRILWNGTGLRQEDFASRLGITTVTLQNYFKNIRLPSSDFIKQTCVEFSVHPEWLLFGGGPMHRGDPHFAQEPGQNTNAIPEDDRRWMSAETAPELGYELVPKVRARLSAGTGSLEAEGEVIGLYAFKRDFLKRKGQPKKMVLMDVVGDSMEPEILSGDTVLIDESQREIISGGLFAVGIDSAVLVKYVDALPGKLSFRSCNERYAPIEVNMAGDLADMVRIIGRVVWSCREYVR